MKKKWGEKLLSGWLSDFTVYIEDHVFNVHKDILIEQSMFFKHLIQYDKNFIYYHKEGIIKPAVFEHILETWYLNSVTPPVSSHPFNFCVDLREACRYLHVTGPLPKCAHDDALVVYLRHDGYTFMGDKYELSEDNPSLISYCNDFIKSHHDHTVCREVNQLRFTKTGDDWGEYFSYYMIINNEKRLWVGSQYPDINEPVDLMPHLLL